MANLACGMYNMRMRGGMPWTEIPLRPRPQPQPTRLAYRVRMLDRVRHLPFHATLGTYFEDTTMTLILGGQGRYRRAGQEQHVTAGMVGLVVGRSGQDPGLLTSDPDDPYDHLYCRFAGHEAREVAQRIEARNEGQPFFHPPQWRKLTRVLKRALAVGPVHNSGSHRDHPIQQDAILMEALVILGGNQPNEPKGLTASQLEAYLNDHIAAPATLDPIASHFGISKSHLCRRSRQLLGMSLHQYWMRLKVQWAQTLLREQPFTVREVAERVGFADAFHFSKTFKRIVGLSPQQWRHDQT